MHKNRKPFEVTTLGFEIFETHISCQKTWKNCEAHWASINLAGSHLVVNSAWAAWLRPPICCCGCCGDVCSLLTVFVDRNPPSLTPRQSVAIALCASSKNYNDLLMFEKAGPSRPSGEIPHRIQPVFVNRAGMYHLSTCYSVRLLEYYVVIPMIFSTR